MIVLFLCILCLFFAAMCGLIAERRGQSRIVWFVTGWILGPFALLAALFMPRAVVIETKTCPRCAEPVRAAAKVCRYCEHAFGEVVRFRQVDSLSDSGLQRRPKPLKSFDDFPAWFAAKVAPNRQK